MNHSVNIVSSDPLPSVNGVYCSLVDLKSWSKSGSPPHIKLRGENPYFAYKLIPHESIKMGSLAMNNHQRIETNVSLNDVVKIEIYPSELAVPVSLLNLVVSFKHKKNRDDYSKRVIGVKLIEIVKENLCGLVLSLNQKFQIKYDNTFLFVQVQAMYEKGSKKAPTLIDENGVLTSDTPIQLSPIDSSIIIDGGDIVDGQPLVVTTPPPLKYDIAFDELGVGGLGTEFRELFRRAFASRCLHPQTVKKLGVLHVRGILLYGPPGTGKTLLARNIAKMLNCPTPKRISGSDVLSKWVGEAERKVRELFIDAELEQKQKGEFSSLHVIIIDELDAICRSRSDSSHNVGDSIVNQLLSKMDGNDVLNNILVIGMTNRKDLIDKALIRPGRFEVHIEISLPNENGRKEILLIHTTEMRQYDRLDKGVDLNDIAKRTRNYSGAELAGMVRSALSFALERSLDLEKVTEQQYNISEDSVIVTQSDFVKAMEEIVPAFGKNRDELSQLLPQCGLITWSEEFKKVILTCNSWIDQLVSSPVLRLMSILISGPPGSGKTTISAHLGTTINIPLVKVVSPENFIGKSDTSIAGELNLIFKDLYRSPASLLIIENIERLLSYSEIGHIYSNSVLQALLILLKKQPPIGKKLFIIGTTADDKAVSLLRIKDIFTKSISLPLVCVDSSWMTIQEVLVEIENDRYTLDENEFIEKLQNFGKPFEALAKLKKVNTTTTTLATAVTTAITTTTTTTTTGDSNKSTQKKSKPQNTENISTPKHTSTSVVEEKKKSSKN